MLSHTRRQCLLKWPSGSSDHIPRSNNSAREWRTSKPSSSPSSNGRGMSCATHARASGLGLSASLHKSASALKPPCWRCSNHIRAPRSSHVPWYPLRHANPSNPFCERACVSSNDVAISIYPSIHPSNHPTHLTHPPIHPSVYVCICLRDGSLLDYVIVVVVVCCCYCYYSRSTLVAEYRLNDRPHRALASSAAYYLQLAPTIPEPLGE